MRSNCRVLLIFETDDLSLISNGFERVFKWTKIRAEIKRILSKDKDKTRKTDTHNKEHAIIKITRTKKQKQRATRIPQKKLGVWTSNTDRVNVFCFLRNICRVTHKMSDSW